MATCHGGTGQPLDRDATPNGKDTDANTPHNYHHEDMDNFENVEQENHTSLATLTSELDDLCHSVQAGEGQQMEALHHIECKLQRLSIVFVHQHHQNLSMMYFSKKNRKLYVLLKSRLTSQTP